MAKTRVVKVDRIKRLRVRGKVAYVKGSKPTDEKMRERAATEMAKEFTRQLLRFKKVSFWEEGYSIHFQTSLESKPGSSFIGDL